MSFQISQVDASLIVRATIIMASGLLAATAMRRLSAGVRHLLLLITAGAAVMLRLALAGAPRWAVAVLPPAAEQHTERAVNAETVGAAPATITPISAPLPQAEAGHQQTIVAGEDAADKGSTWFSLVAALWGVGVVAMVL